MSYAIQAPLLRTRTLRSMGALSYPPQPRVNFPGAEARFLNALRGGLGTMLDNDMFTSAWYLPLIEQVNPQTAARGYQWGPMKYLSNWDALQYNMSFSVFSGPISQSSTLYQWDGSQWRKTSVEAGV